MEHQITQVQITSLREPTTNPNVMMPDQYVMLREAMRVHGCLQPILVRVLDDGNREIIDGVHRARAGRELGWSFHDCVEVHCTEQIATVLRIGLNRMRGQLNLTETARLLDELQRGGMDSTLLATSGFSGKEIDEMVATLTQDFSFAVIDAGAALPEMNLPVTEHKEPTTVFMLEIPFTKKRAMKKAMKSLEKISMGGTLASALEYLIEQHDERQKS